jgi:hypothetical protein
MSDAQYQFLGLMPGVYTLIVQRKTEHGLNLKHHRNSNTGSGLEL